MAKCCGGPPVPPTLNLICNVWYNQFGHPLLGPPPTLANVPCQLRVGELVGPSPPAAARQVWICFAAGTDIAANPRGLFPIGDLIELPAGTGRYYRVDWVEDVGRGFPNQYRVAESHQDPPWPVPTP